MTAASLESVRRLSMGDVSEVVCKSKAKIHALLREKKFPLPIKEGGRNFWAAGVIAEYLANPHPEPTAAPDADKYRKLKATYWQEVKAGTRKQPKPRGKAKHQPKPTKPTKAAQGAMPAVRQAWITKALPDGC